MYFVDRKKIEAHLTYIEQTLQLFSEQKQWNSQVEVLALERIGHVLIESIIDVGNAMIDGFIMRDPGSYEDIIEILLDEKVISKNDAVSLQEVVKLRKMLVHNYLELDDNVLVDTLTVHFDALQHYPPSIRKYLEEELGPVSAFANHTK